jgi:hypothetical protein
VTPTSKHQLLFRRDSIGQTTVAYFLQIAVARGTAVDANKISQGSRPAGFIQTTELPTTSTGQCNKTKSLVTESVCVSSCIACARYRTQSQRFPSLEGGFLAKCCVGEKPRESIVQE